MHTFSFLHLDGIYWIQSKKKKNKEKNGMRNQQEKTKRSPKEKKTLQNNKECQENDLIIGI